MVRLDGVGQPAGVLHRVGGQRGEVLALDQAARQGGEVGRDPDG